MSVKTSKDHNNMTCYEQKDRFFLGSENGFQVLMKSIRYAVLIIEDERLIEVNPAWEIQTGFSREETLTMRWEDFVHPEDKNILDDDKQTCSTIGGASIKKQCKLLTKNSGTILVEYTTAPIKHCGRSAIMIVIEDLTERIQAAEALRRRDAILEAVGFAAKELKKTGEWEKNIDAVLSRLGKASEVSRVTVFENYLSEDGILMNSMRFEWVAPGVISQINSPEFQNLLFEGHGMSRWETTLSKGDIISGHVCDFPDSEQKQLSGYGVKSIIAVPIFVEREWWGYICFDEREGEREWFSGEIDALKSAAAVLGAAMQRRRGDMALKESEERYGKLVETMNEGLVILDENELIIYANNRFLKTMGFEKDDVLGQSLIDFLSEPQKGLMKVCFAKLRIGERKTYEIEWPGKDGRNIFTIVSPEPFFDSQGYFGGCFAVITDITELKEVEKSLREREKELEINTADLEEVNTALRVLLKKREEDKAELEEKVLYNVKGLVLHYLEKLADSGLNNRQTTYVNILESNLKDIISPFTRSLSSPYLNLTPAELEVANLVKQGKTTKEIAIILNLSSKTISTHRNKIRKKLGVLNKKTNLRTHLLAIR